MSGRKKTKAPMLCAGCGVPLTPENTEAERSMTACRECSATPRRSMLTRIQTHGAEEARKERVRAFARGLAEYLCQDQARLSILLEMGHSEGKAWAKLRGLTPVRGWASVEEAEGDICTFLGVSP